MTEISQSFIDPYGRNREEVFSLCSEAVRKIVDFCANSSEYAPLPSQDAIPSQAIPEEGVAFTALWEEIDLLLARSMNPHVPGYIGHMDSVPAVASLIGDFLASAINNNMLSEEMSPLFSCMERDLIGQMGRLFGLPDGCGGVLTSGGSLANLHALAVARNCAFSVKDKGMISLDHPPVIFVSSLAHTSIQKAAMLLGIGVDGVQAIDTDDQGRMDPEQLDEKIKEAKGRGQAPFCVVATAGTTLLGSIDPLKACHQVCKKHGLWLHVDAAYGGAIAFSDQHREKLKGIEMADSITFNPQKWLYVAKTCAMVLFRDHDRMQKNFAITAPYMSGAGVGTNLGEISVQGTRHAEIVKLYLSLRHIGRKGYEALIDKQIDLAQFFAQQLSKNQVQLLAQPELNMVCFTLADDKADRLHKELLQEHRVFFSRPMYQGKRVFRSVLLNPFITREDLSGYAVLLGRGA